MNSFTSKLSLINGDSFVWKINGVSTNIFQAYLREFSTHNPKEYKIVVIDDAGFYFTKNIEVPQNIVLLRIPPYNPELNPCEHVWQYIKNRFKNQRFKSVKSLKEWLSEMLCDMKPETITSITGNQHFLKTFNN